MANSLEVELAAVVLRALIGFLFLAHACRKLFGWFDGYTRGEMVDFFSRKGFRHPEVAAVAAPVLEAAGALLVLSGFFTLGAVAALTGSMTVAMTVHAPEGFWNDRRGTEYPFVLMVVLFVLALVGPGRFSLDAQLGLPVLDGGVWAGAALGTGVVAGRAFSRLMRHRGG